jgi:hypothetical protein
MEIARFTGPDTRFTQVPSSTLGLEAVTSADEATRMSFVADAVEENLLRAAELKEYKVHPSAGRLRYLGGKVMGNAMTPDEAQLVNRAHLHGPDYADGQRETADGLASHAAFWLSVVRRKVTLLPENTKINGYLDQEAPPFLRGLAEGYRTEGRSWAEWLQHGATDEQLANFLEWNTTRTAARQQDPQLVEAVREVHAQYKALAQARINEGLLSAEAQSRLDAVGDLHLFVADPIDAAVRSIRGERLYGGGIVVNQPDLTDPTSVYKEAQTVLPHELTHDVLEDVNRTALEVPWVKEGLTEWTTQVVNPDFAVEAYVENQGVLERLRTGGNVEIDPSVVTRAYSGNDNDKQRYHASLNASWGTEDVLPKVNDFVRLTERTLRGGVSEDVALFYTDVVLEHYPSRIFDTET